MLDSELPPRLLDILIGLEPLVLGPAQAAWIVVDHEAEGGQLCLQRDDLVDLLLILGHDHAHLGVVPDVGELLGDGVLVDGHGHAAQALRGDLRPVQARPVSPITESRSPRANPRAARPRAKSRTCS